MKRIALAAAISTIIASPVFAASYTTVFYSGTATDPSAGFSTAGMNADKAWYVNPNSGTASNPAAPAISVVAFGNWTFDFTNLSAVAFIGTLEIGDFKIQKTATVPFATPVTVDGRETYTGVKYSFSGVGVYDEATNIFTYNFLNTAVNGGGASTYSETGPASCKNGATHIVNKVCAPFSTATKSWEGLALNFLFTENRSNFGGSLVGTQTSGTGLSRITTTINWQSPVPVPAAAWLFGSGLLGLAGVKRRRRSRE